MGHVDDDRPDDSNAPRHEPGSIGEETSTAGQRIKGATEDTIGEVTDDERLEEKGERENEAGRDRQESNDVV